MPTREYFFQHRMHDMHHSEPRIVSRGFDTLGDAHSRTQRGQNACTRASTTPFEQGEPEHHLPTAQRWTPLDRAQLSCGHEMTMSARARPRAARARAAIGHVGGTRSGNECDVTGRECDLRRTSALARLRGHVGSAPDRHGEARARCLRPPRGTRASARASWALGR